MSRGEQFQRSVIRTIMTTHVRVYEMTNGAIGGTFGGPCLILKTIGAKSGVERKTPLGYGRDGEDFLLVASNNGSDQNPAWLTNLRGHGTVEFQVGGEHLQGTARVVRPGDRDYDRLFSLANVAFSGRYYSYQEKTKRPIPLVVLTPA